MPQATITSSARRVSDSGSRPLTVQNLGATYNLYVGSNGDVTATGITGGLRIIPGGERELTDPGEVFLVCASGETTLTAWDNL